ncbi:MAG TPA: D-alanyl-D-alanine carboxypeptidase [Chitinophagaceae bacterium]|nr:D-alanyl-D-alanine carboxypeptidase [Chitinophagaceae bacterium]
MNNFFIFCIAAVMIVGCSSTRNIGRAAGKNLLNSGELKTAHVGISIFEPATGKWWFNHQAEKYFIPASNVKIVTCFEAMKHLGDSLKGIIYSEQENNTAIIEATGDPTLLHPAFPNQPVLEFLRTKQHILINTQNWADDALGAGWSWDDYNESYMTERSPMPMYGNTVRFSKAQQKIADEKLPLISYPRFFEDSLRLSEDISQLADKFAITRDRASNKFLILPSADSFATIQIPFSTNNFELTRKLLRDTLKAGVRTSYYTLPSSSILYSQPTDSVLKLMMYNSDNFLAEQLLLSISNELLPKMNAGKLIVKLLNTDLNNLPQKPRWVDGSGLSRYNLFTPKSMVTVLNQMRDFGMERIKNVFPSGGEGTLSGYYSMQAGSIYAKTGSMSGVVCLSGYLYTSREKELIFSVMVNNHQSTATEVRGAIERFLQQLSSKY